MRAGGAAAVRRQSAQRANVLAPQGELSTAKVPAAIKASGLSAEAAASALTDVLWCVARCAPVCPNPECVQSALSPQRRDSRARARARLLSVEYEGAEAAAASRAKLAEVTKAALQADALSRALLMERCEGEFLELVELIPSAALYKKKEVRSAAINNPSDSWLDADVLRLMFGQRFG